MISSERSGIRRLESSLTQNACLYAWRQHHTAHVTSLRERMGWTNSQEDSSLRSSSSSFLSRAAFYQSRNLRNAQSPIYDLVLRNGRIVDGSGSPWYRGDLAIRGDAIVKVRRPSPNPPGES